MDQTDTQRCGSCKEEKPQALFSPFYRGKPGTWCRSCFAANARGSRQAAEHDPIECIECKNSYIPKQLKAKASFCSRKCKDTAKNRQSAERRRLAKPQRACVWCGANMPQSMRSDAKFCSEQCNSHAHQKTRKLWRQMGITRSELAIAPRVLLAERDGLTCYLCNADLDLTTKHPNPTYASIDHVEPLASGGSHDLTNLKLAHLVCNLRKRDRVAK